MSGAFLIMAALTASAAASPLPPATIWAGDRMILTVTADGARLQGDCSSGTITGALKPNNHGVFVAHGNFSKEAGGPQQADADASVTATFTGHLDGDVLRLVISVSGQPGEQRFALVKGARIKLVRCY
jgi:hypothetical protein